MTDLGHSAEEINAKEPDKFDQQNYILIELGYDYKTKEYTHKVVSQLTSEPVDLTAELDKRSAVISSDVETLKAHLSMEIDICADSMVEIRTKGQDIYWSKRVDAIKTYYNYQVLYGDLKYWSIKAKRWQERETHDDPVATRISFKARLNDHIKNETTHKFSYNVRQRKSTNHLEEYEIDPDIQNPRTRRNGKP